MKGFMRALEISFGLDLWILNGAYSTFENNLSWPALYTLNRTKKQTTDKYENVNE